jgi:hypothetical protein
VGRIFDLSIVDLHFGPNENPDIYPDIKYVRDVLGGIKTLTDRVDSLNLVSEMIWKSPEEISNNGIVDTYNYFLICDDLFLIRFVSILDCALILVNMVYELGLQNQSCTLNNIKQASIEDQAIDAISYIYETQGKIRNERNSRVHHGQENPFTTDDMTFISSARSTFYGNGICGEDIFGKEIDLRNFIKEAQLMHQKRFTEYTDHMTGSLNLLYDMLWLEFEKRFHHKERTATHGLIVRRNT